MSWWWRGCASKVPAVRREPIPCSTMTLNITLASRWLMVQSSDFRLTREGTTHPVSEAAQKQVILQYFDWSGLLCYTGVAVWGRHNTANWLSSVLSHDPGHRSISEVIDHLVTDANRWLSDVPPTQRHHSFTFITYQKKVPRVYLISNFQRGWGVDRAAPTDRLMVSPLRPRRPRCLATGQASSVSERQRHELEDLMASNTPPGRLREAVARASRDSSFRSDGKVGEACVVSHLLPDGSGESQVFGNLKAEFLPSMIVHGQNVAPEMSSVMDPLKSRPARLVGTTWTSNGQASALVAAYRNLTQQSQSGWA